MMILRSLLGAFLFILSVSCQDRLRNRIPLCTPEDASCLGASTLQVNQFRAKLIAHATVDIMVSKTQIVFVSNDSDEERDTQTSFICNLDVEAGAQFTYKIEQGILSVNNGMTNMVLKKKYGSKTELLGTWIMETNEAKVQTILELNFRSDEEIFIAKTCNLRA
jgi:hypothetical protein